MKWSVNRLNPLQNEWNRALYLEPGKCTELGSKKISQWPVRPENFTKKIPQDHSLRSYSAQARLHHHRLPPLQLSSDFQVSKPSFLWLVVLGERLGGRPKPSWSPSLAPRTLLGHWGQQVPCPELTAVDCMPSLSKFLPAGQSCTFLFLHIWFKI